MTNGLKLMKVFVLKFVGYAFWGWLGVYIIVNDG